MNKGKKLKAAGAVLALAGVITAVAATAAHFYVVGVMSIFVGFVVFVVGRFME